jgi:nitroimidazol reductase NimA-like FMN-containing flavoprotein (pyridoxamine 5'-phosphate oxidase superfamily)
LDARTAIRDLLTTQRLAVLATQNHGQPYTHLVTVAADPEQHHVLFPTLRATRKYHNLVTDPRVALLWDTRAGARQGAEEMALAALGTAAEVTGADREPLLQFYLARHPHLADFVHRPDCALVQVRVQRYQLVTRFQDVVELDLSQL